MSRHFFIDSVYIVSIVFFVFGLKMLTSPVTARRGNILSAFGMLLAVVVTLLSRQVVGFTWIGIGLVAGGIAGAFAARLVAMTQMPEMVALFNGFGGLSSLLVGWGTFHMGPPPGAFTAAALFFAVLIGGVTFSGSLVAWGKLSARIGGKPVLFSGQIYLNAAIFLALIGIGVYFATHPGRAYPFLLGSIVLSLLLGILAVVRIGGADMPVVISLLNSYSGMAASAAGFAIQNNVLIVSGALVGSSGIILTRVMCKAMNRSLANVLFGGFGAARGEVAGEVEGEVKQVTPEDAYLILEAADSAVFVPGYGMAVAQAQHVLRELGDLLERNGADVRYAIHPVAGRMPGHMNVLLAEANVPYEKLAEMDDINRVIEGVDVCVVVGANDVVNPAARENPGSPIFGMPIINVDRARTVIVLKRSMAAGFAGIENHLFYKENTRMLFGDAKLSIETLIGEFKGAG